MSADKESQIPNEDNDAEVSNTTERTARSKLDAFRKYIQAVSAILSSCGSIAIRRQLQDHISNFHLTQPALVYPPVILRYSASRESLFGILVVLESIQWFCTVALFVQPRWRMRYLPLVCGLAVIAVLAGALFIGNLTTLFFEIFVAIIDAGIVGCLVADNVSN